MRSTLSRAWGALAALMTAAEATAQSQTFSDSLVQPPVLAAPQRGSLKGQLASVAFGVSDVSRGAFTLPSPFSAPTERGPLLTDPFPHYSPDAGLSEWGMGWRASLSITRHALGHLDYATDTLTGPWGELHRGADGFWYPKGLSAHVRVEQLPDTLVAYLPDGSRSTFGGSVRETTARGTYAWLLTETQTPQGRVTRFTYDTNASGRRFLKTVRYGGLGEDFQYQVDFEYENLRVPHSDWSSSEERVLDRRVRTVIVRSVDTSTGMLQERWRHTLTYAEEASSPTYYLAQVTRTFASGEQAPPTRYTYNTGSQRLTAVQFRPVPQFDPVLSRFRRDTLFPTRSALVDLDEDGRIDLEDGSSLTLARQGDSGFTFEPLAPASGTVYTGCRLAPSSGNPPRLLVKMRPEDDAPRVLDMRYGLEPGKTRVTLCGRDGVPIHQSFVSGNWQFDDSNALATNTRLADVTGDQRPDLVQIQEGGYLLSRNVSTSSTYAFETPQRYGLTPSFSPSMSWIHDMNGDGLADIVSRFNAGVVVWFGKGQGEFETAGRTLPFYADLALMGDLDAYAFTFLDANKDGATDILISAEDIAYLFVNDGRRFSYVRMPALKNLVNTPHGAPVVADIAGSGNTELVVVPAQGSALSLAFAETSTGLMATADDGMGSLLRFSYGRAPPRPGVAQRAVVLSALEVETSGYDKVRYTYDYAGATLHSVGHHLLGFGTVTRTAPSLTHTAHFLQDDTTSGLLLDQSERDALTPDVLRFSSRTYDTVSFQGLPWRRLKEERAGYRDGAASPGVEIDERTEYLSYQADVCPSETVRRSRHGTLTTTKTRAWVPAFAQHLHCLDEDITLRGTHLSPDLNFLHRAHLSRNTLGQVERVESIDGLEVMTLQEVVYRADHLVDRITLPGRGTTRFDWHPGTSQLRRVEAPDGVVVQATSFHPVTDALLELTTSRGLNRMAQRFRYDGQERLVKQWDDLGGASETTPNMLLAYHYATATQPGNVAVKTLVDAALGVVTSSVEWQTGAGEGVGQAVRTPEGWVVDGLTTRSRNLLEVKKHVRPVLTAQTDVTTLDYTRLLADTDVVSTLRSSGLGEEAESLVRLHADVTRQQRTEWSLEDGLLRQEAIENGTHSQRRYLDASKRLVAYEDEARARYTYTHDALGRLRQVRLPDGKSHRVSFDGHGRAASVVRDGVASVTYAYVPGTMSQSKKTFRTLQGVPIREESYAYDAIGRKLSDLHTDLLSGATQLNRYYYDGATPEQPLRRDMPGLLTAVEGDDFQKRFAYRVDGKLTYHSLRLSNWRTVDSALSYRENGSVRQEVVCLRDASGAILQCTTQGNTPDAFGRTESMSLNGTPLAALAYNGQGQLATASLHGIGQVTFTYDSLTRAPVGFSQATPHLTSSTSWRYDARGLIGSETLAVGALGLQRVHGYSAQRFLSSSTDSQGSYGYGYDASGLPTTISEEGVTRTLTQVGNTLQVGGVTYTFDGLGRTVSKDELLLAYGPNGHLARATRGERSWEYSYDEKGQRLMKREGGLILAAYLPGGAYLDGTGLTQPLRLGGRLVGTLRNNVYQPLATDMRGTVMADTDGTPRMASPYGQRALHPDSAAAIDYVEKGYDADLGLIRMGVRDYDAFINRFTTPDPLYLETPEKCSTSPLDCNLYGYARNDPLSFTDPSGMEPTTRRSGDRVDREHERDQENGQKPGHNPDNSHFASDWAGRAILLHYLRGGGDWDVVDEPQWSVYMMQNETLRNVVDTRLVSLALQGIKDHPSGGSVEIKEQFHVEIENGEGVIGYQYLHGSNPAAGDFQITGTMDIQLKNTPGGPMYSVSFQTTYKWNDIMDRNDDYETDKFKDKVANVISGTMAAPFTFSVSWDSNPIYSFDPKGNRMGGAEWPTK
ncbi:RHS repeat-associated core domain-containing protein [Melittangium boletus]|uniref:Teneurin-like YD-shell domain-containing protein n=1 Tax=Melittangium boletus DSM 14713 TaxID=1294270 RepID=A0A250IPT8_9BACT|nr:RHS repeat-associated core domain-containing protein [Melittangium boletus]ATB33250.1 hypothetical protein MEBOL_006741 [Melittangium boletus DSM 14713]